MVKCISIPKDVYFSGEILQLLRMHGLRLREIINIRRIKKLFSPTSTQIKILESKQWLARRRREWAGEGGAWRRTPSWCARARGAYGLHYRRADLLARPWRKE